MNPKDVLTQTADRPPRRRRATAIRPSCIRTAAEVNDPASRPKVGGTLTWHFHMDHTRDVVWSACPVFVWDAARINLPDGKTEPRRNACIRRRAWATDAWARSTEYVKDTVERLLEAVVSLSVAGGHQRGRIFDRHGVSGHRLRRHRRQGQDALLGHRARDRARLVSHDRRLERAPQCLHGRGLQHLHRH